MALSLEQNTFLEIIKEAEYETAFIGKWHNRDLGKDRSLDYYFGFKGQGKIPRTPLFRKIADLIRNIKDM